MARVNVGTGSAMVFVLVVTAGADMVSLRVSHHTWSVQRPVLFLCWEQKKESRADSRKSMRTSGKERTMLRRPQPYASDNIKSLVLAEADPSRRGRGAGLLATALLVLTFGLGLFAPRSASAAFGLTTLADRYQVDTGAGLVFQILRGNGNLVSLKYNGVELQDQSKPSGIASGFYVYGNDTMSVDATTSGTDSIKITVTDTAPAGTMGQLIHYYMARKGENNLYMATYVTAEPHVGELRYIARLRTEALPHCPKPSDLRGTTGPIESKDVFGLSNGETRSKYYGRERAMDYTSRGVTGKGVGVYMVYGSRESSSGGPFYRDIQDQTGSQQELYNYMNSGHEQTEPVRLGVLYSPYVYAVTNGPPPALPLDTEWIAGLGLTGWVPLSQRGSVVGKASGIPAGLEGVVGFANPTAQYWCKVDPTTGKFTSPPMKPGDYAMTLYQGELAVATGKVTVSQSAAPVVKDIASTKSAPKYLWRIGEWDGTPQGFLNADKITEMHPSDVRMGPWGPVTYTVGSSPLGSFPMAQWKAVNNPTTIKFNLTAAQIKAHILRVGVTVGYAGGRPQVTVNSWTSKGPSEKGQPKSRSLTVGTYRGNNATYTYDIPASAFVVGENTLTISVLSGSGGALFLSPGYAYDAVELD